MFCPKLKATQELKPFFLPEQGGNASYLDIKLLIRTRYKQTCLRFWGISSAAVFVDGGTAVTLPSMDTVVSRGFLRSKVIDEGQGNLIIYLQKNTIKQKGENIPCLPY